MVAKEWIINWDDLTFPRKMVSVNGSVNSPFGLRSRTNTNTTRTAGILTGLGREKCMPGARAVLLLAALRLDIKKDDVRKELGFVTVIATTEINYNTK